MLDHDLLHWPGCFRAWLNAPVAPYGDSRPAILSADPRRPGKLTDVRPVSVAQHAHSDSRSRRSYAPTPNASRSRAATMYGRGGARRRSGREGSHAADTRERVGVST